MTTIHTPDLLSAIVACVRRSVEIRRAAEPIGELSRRAEERHTDGRAFLAALQRPEMVNVIAECKRRSPAKGVLRQDYDAAEIAAGYERAGAAACSILTEPAFFDGSLADLERVRRRVDLPLLRKDFVVEEYQVIEARAAGADAILLIVAALEQRALRALLGVAARLELSALVEVHNRSELDRALEAGAGIVGVNNRNLRTLEVTIETSDALIEHIPNDVVAVAESGLRSASEIHRLRARGYDAFLIGERLMSAANPGAALEALLKGELCA